MYDTKLCYIIIINSYWYVNLIFIHYFTKYFATEFIFIHILHDIPHYQEVVPSCEYNNHYNEDYLLSGIYIYISHFEQSLISISNIIILLRL